MSEEITLSMRIGRPTLETLLLSWVDEKPDKNAVKLIEKALSDHFIALIATGAVRPYDALPNRRMHLMSDWNMMFDPDIRKRQDGAENVARRLAHHMVIIHIVYLGFDLRRGGGAEAQRMGLDQAMAKIDAGEARWWRIGGCERDFVSGEEFDYEIVDWNLVIGRRGSIREGLQPIDDMPPQTLHQVEIDIPTGHLLLADWLSTGDMSDGFTDMVDEGNPWRGCSQLENEQDAERYARDHGFVSVASAHRCLSVLTNGNTVTVGRFDEDGEHPLPVGYALARGLLVIDLRKVSVADRSSLVELYSRMHDTKQAKSYVDDVSKDHDTVNLRVSPGRYRMISSGRGYIKDLLPDGHALKVEGYKPVMILEKT